MNRDERAALFMQLLAIRGGDSDEGLFEVRFIDRESSKRRMQQLFVACSRPMDALAPIQSLAAETDVYVGAAPRRERRGGRDAVARVWSIWADIDTQDAFARLAAFRPQAQLVIATGGGWHAWWPLCQPLAPLDAEGANRRLARHLGADERATDAARILRPAGTLNWKYDPPRPVKCVAWVDGYGRMTAADVLADVPVLAAPARRVVLPAPRCDTADPLRGIPAAEYVPALTGRDVGRDGKARCPFHGGGEERTPSLHAFDDPDRGWFCFGCERGGSIIDFGAMLYGIDPRGRGFHDVRRRLARDLIRGSDGTVTR